MHQQCELYGSPSRFKSCCISILSTDSPDLPALSEGYGVGSKLGSELEGHRILTVDRGIYGDDGRKDGAMFEMTIQMMQDSSADEKLPISELNQFSKVLAVGIRYATIIRTPKTRHTLRTRASVRIWMMGSCHSRSLCVVPVIRWLRESSLGFSSNGGLLNRLRGMSRCRFWIFFVARGVGTYTGCPPGAAEAGGGCSFELRGCCW